MVEQIQKCQKCDLCFNQRPLLDSEKECHVFWVGLSAKKMASDSEMPLSPETNTGMLIQKIEEMCAEIVTYKTNLVKCLPLTVDQKLRYPNNKEIDCCFENLVNEINAMSPKIVILLGEKVYSAVARHFNINFDKWNKFDYNYKEINGIFFVPVHHPSFIYVYRRKSMNAYIKSIENVIKKLL